METQAKLLNKDYLETRLRDLSVIRKKEFSFKIHESDRALSRTLYIEFWKKEGENYHFQKDFSQPNRNHKTNSYYFITCMIHMYLVCT